MSPTGANLGQLVAARLVAASLVAASLVAASLVAARGHAPANPSQDPAREGVCCYAFARRLDLLYLLTSPSRLISSKVAAGISFATYVSILSFVTCVVKLLQHNLFF